MSAEVSSSVKSRPAINRISSWLILAAIILPMLGAWLVFSTGVGMPDGSINKGDLLQPPTSLQSLPLTDRKGERQTPWAEGKDKKWRWLIVGSNQCGEVCRQQLYLSRQVHIRLSEKADRVERFYVNTDARYSPALSQWLSAEHPHLRQLHTDGREWRKLLQDASVAQVPLDGASIYLVDQEGFAMMHYDQRHQGSDLLADVKRLLKYSYAE